MYLYRIRTSRPVPLDGMDAVYVSDGSKVRACVLHPVQDTVDDVLIRFLDDDEVVVVSVKDMEDEWLEIDLHDPVIALKIVLQVGELLGEDHRFLMRKEVLVSLMTKSSQALQDRRERLETLLFDLDTLGVGQA